jgi:hypothetical protein
MKMALTNTLKIGMRDSGPGGAVTGLQLALRDLGFNPGEIDGQFGGATEAAVKAFQFREGLPDDGIVGPQTKTALATAIATRDVAAQVASFLPGGQAGAGAAAATGAGAGADQVLKGRIVDDSNAPVWKQGWFLLTAGGLAAATVAALMMKSSPKPKLAAFEDFEDDDAISDLADLDDVEEDGDEELEDKPKKKRKPRKKAKKEEPDGDDAVAAPPAAPEPIKEEAAAAAA